MKFVVLDRDGVINYDSPNFIKSPEEWKPIPGSLEAIASLNQAGFHVVLATNQSGLERGLLDMATLNAIHDKMSRLLIHHGGRIEALFYCPHSSETGCECRKPKPGLLREIALRFNIDMRGVPNIGDSLRDLQCAAEMGCLPILVKTGKGKKTEATGGLPENTLIFDDLAQAAQHLITYAQ